MQVGVLQRSIEACRSDASILLFVFFKVIELYSNRGILNPIALSNTIFTCLQTKFLYICVSKKICLLHLILPHTI